MSMNESGVARDGDSQSSQGFAPSHDVGGVAAPQLRSFVERIERLEEEKAALAADIRDVYSQAKSAGFDPKIMRAVIRLRKLDQADRQEQETLIDVYKRALDMG